MSLEALKAQNDINVVLYFFDRIFMREDPHRPFFQLVHARGISTGGQGYPSILLGLIFVDFEFVLLRNFFVEVAWETAWAHSTSSAATKTMWAFALPHRPLGFPPSSLMVFGLSVVVEICDHMSHNKGTHLCPRAVWEFSCLWGCSEWFNSSRDKSTLSWPSKVPGVNPSNNRNESQYGKERRPHPILTIIAIINVSLRGRPDQPPKTKAGEQAFS